MANGKRMARKWHHEAQIAQQKRFRFVEKSSQGSSEVSSLSSAGRRSRLVKKSSMGSSDVSSLSSAGTGSDLIHVEINSGRKQLLLNNARRIENQKKKDSKDSKDLENTPLLKFSKNKTIDVKEQKTTPSFEREDTLFPNISLYFILTASPKINILQIKERMPKNAKSTNT